MVSVSSIAASGANWLGLAHGVLTKEKPPTLPFVLGKDVNQLTADDLLVSYGLSVYLIEGHPDLAPKILRRAAKEPAVTVLEEELGVTLKELQSDLTEWLKEMS